VAAIPASYFGGLGFETRPVNRIYRYDFLVRFYELQEIISFTQILMLSNIFQLMTHKNHFNTTGKVRINATLGRIRVIVMAVEKQ
jgi:hypothetical protein